MWFFYIFWIQISQKYQIHTGDPKKGMDYFRFWSVPLYLYIKALGHASHTIKSANKALNVLWLFWPFVPNETKFQKAAGTPSASGLGGTDICFPSSSGGQALALPLPNLSMAVPQKTVPHVWIPLESSPVCRFDHAPSQGRAWRSCQRRLGYMSWENRISNCCGPTQPFGITYIYI